MSPWSTWCLGSSFSLVLTKMSADVQGKPSVIKYLLQWSVMGQDLFAIGSSEYLTFSWVQKAAGQVHAVEVQQGLWRTKLPSPAQELQTLGGWGSQDTGLKMRKSSSEITRWPACKNGLASLWPDLLNCALILILLHFSSSAVILPPQTTP